MVGNGVPSGSRGRVTTTAGLPHGQRYATPTTPRGGRCNCAVTTDSSAAVMGSSTVVILPVGQVSAITRAASDAEVGGFHARLREQHTKLGYG